MKTTKRILSLLLSLTLIVGAVVVMPITAEAISTPIELESTAVNFWADPENRIKQSDLYNFASGDKTSMVGAVGVFARSTSSSNFYLFLPSNADCNNLKVWFLADYATVNGSTVVSGQPTDVFKDADEGGTKLVYTLNLGGETYTLNVMKSGDVGAVYIDTSSGSMSSIHSSKDNSESGTIMVVNADGTLEYDGELSSIKGRGNATWGYDKKPYNIKLANSTKLLGMPKARKWCLMANHVDGSLIKNQLTYDFADYIGIKYQPHCKPVDLYINQQYYGSYALSEKVEIKSNRINVTDNYENLEIANGTVDEATGTVIPADMDTLGLSTRTINADNSTTYYTEYSSNYHGHSIGSRRYSAYAKTSNTGINYTNINDPSDLTGGYLFELEISQRWAVENCGFCAYNRQGWVVKSNDYISRHQIDYCYPLLYAIGGAIYNGGTVPSRSVETNCSSLGSTLAYGDRSVTNPAPESQYRGKRWSELLDADSAVKYYWTQEYFKNMDSSVSSTYFFKDVDSVDSKVYAGPLWDMDNSIGYSSNGSRWGHSWTSTSGWYTKNTRIYRWRTRDTSTSYSKDSEAPLSFYGALATNCDDFTTMAKSEWYNTISPAVDILTASEDDDNGVLHNVDYYVDTVEKSGKMNALRLYENSDYNADTIKTGIRNWLTARQTWINGEFPKTDISTCNFANIDNQTCTGSPIEPGVTITDGSTTLQEGKDYTLTYTNNIAAGAARIKVDGTGKYEGSYNLNFNIVKGIFEGSAQIPAAAYKDDVLNVSVTNENGDDVSDLVTLQWYADNVAIGGATSNEYNVSASDAGKTIKVVASGDNVSLAGSVTSNECTIYAGEKPTNYTETLAQWVYDYSLNEADLANADTSGGYAYPATDGQLKETALLKGSVNATSTAKIKWSEDLYSNPTTVITKDYSPIISTDKSDGLAWGEYPYFETTLNTLGYENISFSAKLGGTNRGPGVWKLQYSLNGTNYINIPNSTYTIAKNKTMYDAFSDVTLPDACSNVKNLRIRAVACDDVAINTTYRIVGIPSGDASINNVYVKGTRITAITELDAPTIINKSDNGDASVLFDTDTISIRDNNGGAEVYYSLGGEYKLYNGEFSPFDDNAEVGDTVTLSTYSKFEDIVSDTTTATYTFGGYDINHFVYDTYTENVTNGALYSNGGAFDGSGKMTTYTNGVSQYVPLWNEKNGAFLIAPDDGALWSEYSGYTFEISTSGYEDVSLTAKMYTTAQGPNSVTMQYSLDGGTWNAVEQNIALNANGALEQTFMNYNLPAACDNQKQVFIRLITTENKTHGSATTPSTRLHNNASKGNLYINDIIFAGNQSGDAKMPYTNKTSDYFGDTGNLKYYSADGDNMHYSVVDSDKNIILSGNYNSESGIVIQNATDFNPYSNEGYTVSVWSGDGEDRSPVNTRTYYYKGTTICEFNYNSSSRALAYYLDSTGTKASSTSGAEGELMMYPNGYTPATLVYDDTYTVKVAWASDNFFMYDKSTPLDTPDENGYWYIKTTTRGYHDITLNLEQLSSNKGPRDWGLAYSTNGSTYTYIPSSNVRSISNDASASTVETYNNFKLPSACDNQEELYLKLFINGGETIEGDELVDMLKGNTGIDNIVISGIENAPATDVTINTVVLENELDTTGTIPTDATVSIDGNTFRTEDGSATVQLTIGETYTAEVSKNGTFVNSYTFKVKPNSEITVPVVCVDMNGDGVINGRDWGYITQLDDEDLSDVYKHSFESLVGKRSDSFNYEK